MAHAAPDLASCLGSGEMSRKEGYFGTPGEPEVQNQDPPGRAGLVPQNFVWRFAGRRTSSTSSADEVVAGDMAVGVPVLRERFDPWRHDPQEEENDGQEERCKGCSKISKARAAATQPPHDPPPGKFVVCFPHVCICISIGPFSLTVLPQTPTWAARSVPA